MSQDTAVVAPLYSPMAADPDLGVIVDMFVEEMPERITLIQQMLDSADWEGLRRAAHQLKGSAGSHGFMTISPLAAKVEHDVSDGKPEEQIRRDVDALIALCQCIRPGTPE